MLMAMAGETVKKTPGSPLLGEGDIAGGVVGRWAPNFPAAWST
jgi:hypothetical protein